MCHLFRLQMLKEIAQHLFTVLKMLHGFSHPPVAHYRPSGGLAASWLILHHGATIKADKCNGDSRMAKILIETILLTNVNTYSAETRGQKADGSIGRVGGVSAERLRGNPLTIPFLAGNQRLGFLMS